MISADFESFEPGHSHRHRSYNDLPEITTSSLLDRYLSRVSETIKSDGLKSLYWVTGIHTQAIASSLLDVLSQQTTETLELLAESCCIIAKPGEDRVVEPFSSRFGISVMRMEESYDDSFLIVNGASLLDVTPVAADNGAPEFHNDPTVVSLYLGLFNMLKNRSVST